MSDQNQNNSNRKISFSDDFSMTINGKAVYANATFPVINPATEEIFAYAQECSPEQLDEAIQAAQKAFASWSATPIEVRRGKMLAMADAIDANIEPLSMLLTLEQGKPVAASRMEIQGGMDWLRRTAKLEIPGERREVDGSIATVRHIPLGIVAAIPAWNYPVNLSFMKIAPALLTGNTLILKQSKFTPLAMLKIAEICRDVLPAGVFSVISSSGGIDSLMSSHPGFAKVSYTGSTATGRKIMESAAKTLKHLTLELGGNDAAIVLPDVDVANVAQILFWASFTNSGQICVATKRIYVHEDIYDQFVKTFVGLVATVKVGNGLDEDTVFGPISNRPQYDRVVELIGDSIDNGHEILTGGLPSADRGFFIPLTVIGNPPKDARIVKEEQFGPVIPILKFKNVEEAIEEVNAVEFGLGGIVWAGNTEVGVEIAQQIESGTVWVNQFQQLAPEVPFGGRKQSGIGSEGGSEGLLAYTTPQTIWTKISNQP
jgi:aldehyde dehydrogenase (NAD+)